MSEEKKVPNPYGRLGGPEHRAKVREVAEEVQKRGLLARLEVLIELFTGKKRIMDIGGFEPDNAEEPVEFILKEEYKMTSFLFIILGFLNNTIKGVWGRSLQAAGRLPATLSYER